MKTNLLLVGALASCFYVYSQNGGVSYTGGYDDFMDAYPSVSGIQEYSFETNLPAVPPATGNAWMGLYWTSYTFGGFTANKNRVGDGSLRYNVTQPQGQYIPFHVNFGEFFNGSAPAPITMDLSANAFVSFKIANLGSDTVKLYVRLKDINDVELTFDQAVLNDLNNTWKYYTGFVEGETDPLKPGDTLTFAYDFKKAIPRSSQNGSIPDPNLVFDYSQVKEVTFTLVNFKNTGAPNWQPLDLLNYPIVFLEFFRIGNYVPSSYGDILYSLDDKEVTVYDIMGNLVGKGKFNELNLTKGNVYLVVKDGKTKKFVKF